MATSTIEIPLDTMELDNLVKKLHEIGGIKFGDFKLKSGVISPIYFDLRIVISYPQLLKSISSLIWKKSESQKLGFDVICGIPYTALPVATVVSSLSGIPMILKRKEAKEYGTMQMVEGGFEPSQRCLLIEDVVTTGSSIVETANVLRSHHLIITDVICILDRGQGAKENLAHHGIQLYSILNVPRILTILRNENILNPEKYDEVLKFLNQNLTSSDLEIGKLINHRLTQVTCPQAKQLLNIMLHKKSNLCISFDLDTWWDVLTAVEELGPTLCVVKLHLDTYNFDSYEQVLEFRRKLLELSETQSFLIMEDRKYADIGYTVEKQLRSRPYEVSKWIHLVTVHGIPGTGILRSISQFSNLSAILISEMSSEGNLTSNTYSKEIVKLTEGYESLVTGFVSQSPNVTKSSNWFLQFTPGVSLDSTADTLGQQYVTIETAIQNRGADIIIVGRGILGKEKNERFRLAQEYQHQAWKAWTTRMLFKSV